MRLLIIIFHLIPSRPNPRDYQIGDEITDENGIAIPRPITVKKFTITERKSKSRPQQMPKTGPLTSLVNPTIAREKRKVNNSMRHEDFVWGEEG